MADKLNALKVAAPKNSRFGTGKKTRTVEYEGVFTNTNSADGDKCVLAEGLLLSSRISAVRPNAAGTPALTSANNNDLGFFTKDADGVLVELDKDILWDGVDLSSALTHPNLLTALNPSLDHSKNIGQLLEMTEDEYPANGIFLVLTTNVANTAASAKLRLAIDIDEGTTV